MNFVVQYHGICFFYISKEYFYTHTMGRYMSKTYSHFFIEKTNFLVIAWETYGLVLDRAIP